MGELKNAGVSTGVPGKVLVSPFYGGFAEGAAVATAEGGWLVFPSKEHPDPSESWPSIRAYLLSAVAPIPDRVPGDDVRVFSLTTALVDAEGQLWQRTRIVHIEEIWRALLERPVFLAHFEDPVKQSENAKAVSRRVLLEPIETLCDMREKLLVEIRRERKIEPAPAPGEKPVGPTPERRLFGFRIRKESKPTPAPEPARVLLPGELVERLLFRFRFKYFGAKIGLIEDQIAYRSTTPAANSVSYDNDMTFTIKPTTEADLIVALDVNDAVLPTKDVRLSELGTLWSSAPYSILKAGWEKPSSELVRRGDLAAWQQAYREAGADPTKVEGFKPNAEVRCVDSLEVKRPS